MLNLIDEHSREVPDDPVGTKMEFGQGASKRWPT